MNKAQTFIYNLATQKLQLMRFTDQPITALEIDRAIDAAVDYSGKRNEDLDPIRGKLAAWMTP